MAAAGVRMFAMIRCAIEQQAAANAVLGSSPVDTDNLSRVERRDIKSAKIQKNGFGGQVCDNFTVVQFLLAMYLMFVLGSNTSSSGCALVSLLGNGWWKKHLLVIFVIMLCFVAILQCFANTDVLRWRSFYDMQDSAWKAHYHEVFDHGIREALCCLGHVKYLENIEEDEVNIVAQLLGDLVTYRASGTGHLEFLAGLCLLHV
ncbi:Amino acid transporter AVT6B [Bienertia sinuspersici]